MSDDDKTPAEGTDTMGLVLQKLTDIDNKVDDTRTLARRTFDLQMEMLEHFKALDKRVTVLEQRHVWLPVAALVTSLFAVLISVLVAVRVF